MKKNTLKSEKYQIRLSKSERQVLEKATELAGDIFQVSDLFRDSATLTAENIILINNSSDSEAAFREAVSLYANQLGYMVGMAGRGLPLHMEIKITVSRF